MVEKYNLPSGFTIISGGQTGADQAALDWAIARGIAHGGWCPKGRRSEEGPIDSKYHLKETPTTAYLERTKLNVRDGDATLIFTLTKELEGGSKKTWEFADKLGKPSRHVHPDVDPRFIVQFLERNRVKVLNVAGKRESSAPGISVWVDEFLSRIFAVDSNTA